MEESIKKLPAGEIKKRVLKRQIDMDSLDQDMVLYLLDYEISCFVEDIGETKFYRMCVKALSKFIDFEITDQNVSHVVASAYFMCFSKRQQKRLLKQARKKEGRESRERKLRFLNMRLVARVVAVTFLLILFLVGPGDVYPTDAIDIFELSVPPASDYIAGNRTREKRLSSDGTHMRMTLIPETGSNESA